MTPRAARPDPSRRDSDRHEQPNAACLRLHRCRRRSCPGSLMVCVRARQVRYRHCQAHRRRLACNDPTVSAPVRLLIRSLPRGMPRPGSLHTGRLMRTPAVVKLDPVADHAHRMLPAVEPDHRLERLGQFRLHLRRRWCTERRSTPNPPRVHSQWSMHPLHHSRPQQPESPRCVPGTAKGQKRRPPLREAFRFQRSIRDVTASRLRTHPRRSRRCRRRP